MQTGERALSVGGTHSVKANGTGILRCRNKEQKTFHNKLTTFFLTRCFLTSPPSTKKSLLLLMAGFASAPAWFGSAQLSPLSFLFVAAQRKGSGARKSKSRVPAAAMDALDYFHQQTIFASQQHTQGSSQCLCCSDFSKVDIEKSSAVGGVLELIGSKQRRQ